MRGRALAAVLLSGAIALAAAAILWRATRGPLGGDLAHDFGAVELTGSSSAFEHTYRLVNRRGEPLVIAAVRPGCGCTTVGPGPFEIAPGGTLELPVTLRLMRAGRKETTIHLELQGRDPVELGLAATGVREVGLWIHQQHVRLSRDGSVPLNLIAEISSGDEPPAPEVASPGGVSTAFRGWTLAVAADPGRHRPATWRGRVDLAPGEGELPADAVVRVSIPGAEAVEVSVLPAGTGAP